MYAQLNHPLCKLPENYHRPEYKHEIIAILKYNMGKLHLSPDYEIS